MRVLIATNDETFTPSLVGAYTDKGWEVTTGVDNFYYHSAMYDLIHLHWPEELVNWNTPNEAALRRLENTLRAWGAATTIVDTVHNLMPHRFPENPRDLTLYKVVYENCDVLGHFSDDSKRQVSARFPDLNPNHIVHPPLLYYDRNDYRIGREQARQRLNLTKDDFAILILGALREEKEWELVRSATNRVRTGGMRVIFASSLPSASGSRRLRQKIKFSMWRRRNSVATINKYIPPSHVPQLFEAADVVVIPRSRPHLNSGLLSVAMNIGTPIAGPNYGVYAEYLSGTENELYEPGDAYDLACAIDRLAEKDRDDLAAANRAIACEWGWPKILDSYLPMLPHEKLRCTRNTPAGVVTS